MVRVPTSAHPSPYHQVQHDRLFTLFWVSPGRFIDAAPYMAFRVVRRKIVGGFRFVRRLGSGKGPAAVPPHAEFDEESADATQGQIPNACAR